LQARTNLTGRCKFLRNKCGKDTKTEPGIHECGEPFVLPFNSPLPSSSPLLPQFVIPPSSPSFPPARHSGVGFIDFRISVFGAAYPLPPTPHKSLPPSNSSFWSRFHRLQNLRIGPVWPICRQTPSPQIRPPHQFAIPPTSSPFLPRIRHSSPPVRHPPSSSSFWSRLHRLQNLRIGPVWPICRQTPSPQIRPPHQFAIPPPVRHSSLKFAIPPSSSPFPPPARHSGVGFIDFRISVLVLSGPFAAQLPTHKSVLPTSSPFLPPVRHSSPPARHSGVGFIDFRISVLVLLTHCLPSRTYSPLPSSSSFWSRFIDFRISVFGPAYAFSVQFKYPDPNLAWEVNSELVSLLTGENLRSAEESKMRGHPQPPETLAVLNAPSLPARPDGLSRSEQYAIGLLGGLGCAAGRQREPSTADS
jgi:hypothetical protein